jgi:Xaa-Pro dipeptidase
MKRGLVLGVLAVAGSAVLLSAQIDTETSRSGGEALRLLRNNKLDLILPGAMRDNKIDMWIHATRQGDPDPLALQFGSTYGYLVFTDRGGKIERASFGGSGAVEHIDVRGSDAFARAISSYGEGYRRAFGFGDEVYGEFRQFVEARDPKTIAIDTSDWLAEADGMSHTSYLKLMKILGPKYSARTVSSEKLVSDFIVRRTLNEITAQANALELGYRLHQEALGRIVPGRTTIREITGWATEWAYQRHLAGFSTPGPGGIRVYYSPASKPPPYPPSVRYWIWHPDHVFQRGDFFAFNVGVDYLGFGTDTKTHAYILREGETSVPESIQKTFDLAVAAQKIMREHMRVGMTARQSLAEMVAAMEKAGYVYTPFENSGIQGTGLTDDKKGEKDYVMVQQALGSSDKTGFAIDNHAFGSYNTIGPSMSNFRADRLDLTIQENHLFAFEYMIHRNIPERPGFPLAINISNVQVISSRGVEMLQPPPERIVLLH